MRRVDDFLIVDCLLSAKSNSSRRVCRRRRASNVSAGAGGIAAGEC